MNDKIQSDEPANEEHRQSERKIDSMAQNNCASSTDTSKTTEQPEKTPARIGTVRQLTFRTR